MKLEDRISLSKVVSIQSKITADNIEEIGVDPRRKIFIGTTCGHSKFSLRLMFSEILEKLY